MGNFQPKSGFKCLIFKLERDSTKIGHIAIPMDTFKFLSTWRFHRILLRVKQKCPIRIFFLFSFSGKTKQKKINFENCFLVFTLSTTFSEKTQIGKTVFINTDRKDSFYNLISFDFL